MIKQFYLTYIWHPDIGLAVRVFANRQWYLMPPCLTLSIIRYGSRVKWSNPGKGVAPSPTPYRKAIEKAAFGSQAIESFGSKAIEKGAFGSPSTMVAYFTYFTYMASSQILRLRVREDLLAMEGVLHITQSSRTRVSPSEAVVSYPGNSLGESLPLCIDVVSVFYNSLRRLVS